MKEKDLQPEQLKFICGLGLPEKTVKLAIKEAGNLTDLATGLYLLVSNANQRVEIAKRICAPDGEAIESILIEILRRRYDT